MKNKEFDNILNECLERLLINGETVEQCLQSFPEHADELKPLLETALAVKKTSAIQPSSEFRDKARYQFYAALQGMEPKKNRLVFSWRPLWTTRPLWATMVAVILALLLAGSGTVMAAGGSMPDEPLYPVKLATEQARLVLTPSALGKAEFYARLADKRVLEIIRMAGEGKPEQIELTARRLDIHLARIAELASIQKVSQEIASGAPEALLAEEVPAAKEAPRRKSAPALESSTTDEAAPALESAPLLPERGRDVHKTRTRGNHHRDRLRATVGRHARNHPASLRALLQRVPASARPALLRAIAVSETGYEKALRSLD